MNRNPFYLETMPLGAPFCDRELELEQLMARGRSGVNVVLFSPRRYGKTSLVRRVQAGLREEGVVTVFCDLYGVTSVGEIAGRIARAVFSAVRENDSLFRKAVSILSSFRPVLKPDPQDGFSVSVQPAHGVPGPDLLDQALAELQKFIDRTGHRVHVVLDEFQEITEVETGIQVQGIMRSRIQEMDCSFVFVGSRRRVLLDMFTSRKKPFFQSAMHMQLGPLPEKDAVRYMEDRFAFAGIVMGSGAAETVVRRVEGYPFYLQKICFLLFELGKSPIQSAEVQQGFEGLLASERFTFELILQSLTTRQINLLRGVAEERTASPYAARYMATHGLASVGGVQAALKVLVSLDLVEQGEDKVWRVTDPVFEEWLQRMG